MSNDNDDDDNNEIMMMMMMIPVVGTFFYLEIAYKCVQKYHYL
jgi:hypothetical protein